MRSRTLPITLVLSLATLSVACGDDENSGVSASTTLSGTGSTDSDSMTSAETGTASMTGDGDGDMSGDGDGDPATGDGDGDPATGDGDPTGDGDGDPTGDGDGDPTGDGDGDMTGDGDGDMPPECVDLDQDGYGDNCDMGPDCDDDDWYNWTDEGCANCADADQDNYWVGCDQFDDNQPGVDCDDNNFNVYTDDGCANCVDEDMDDVWVGCDQYGDDAPGPDCDDNNANVGLMDEVEICNGLAENCAGEIDNAPANEMCPPNGVDAPNVENWACNPPAPGQDGCEIAGCVDQAWDLDDDIDGGCECVGTDRDDSLANCSLDPEGDLGTLNEGNELLDIPSGIIPEIDNGIGGGAEDWYHFDIPENGGGGDRPNSGSIQVSFAVNDGLDYRFEVYRSCGGAAFANGLAIQYGQGAPPVQEWWFFDNHVLEPGYTDNVSWPGTVYVRVFRVQNDGTCNDYQLHAQRPAN